MIILNSIYILYLTGQMRRLPCARCVSTSPRLSLRPVSSLPIIVTIVSHHENCTLKRFPVYMLLFVNKAVSKLTHGNIIKAGVVAQLLCFSYWVSLWELIAEMKLLKTLNSSSSLFGNFEKPLLNLHSTQRPKLFSSENLAGIIIQGDSI